MINENLKIMKRLKRISLSCKNENELDNWELRNEGCAAIFNSFKYLSNLEVLWLSGNIE